MKITILDGHTLNPGDNPWDDLARLGELTIYDRTAPGDIISRARDAGIILTNKTPLTSDTIACLPRLKFVAVLATGYNVVDTAAARARGIPVSNVPTYGTMSVAQHALALLLELANNAGAAHSSVREGRWSACPDFCYWDKSTVELDGLTLGVVGFGRIGRQMARLGAALGMRILYTDRAEIAPPGVAARRVPLEELFTEADAISLHCNQTDENLRFVNATLLGKMKNSAFLINTARGTLINEADLAAALSAGRLAGAGLDVLETEPPPASHPLLAAPNCIITPHVAWSSLAGRKRLMQTTVASVRGFLAGAPVNVINK